MSKTPLVWYTAGPYRAAGPWATEMNIRNAEEVAQSLRLHGQYVICPHTNCRWSDQQVTDAQYLAETMELMRRSDVVLVLPNWADSEGTCGEIDEAERLAMPCLYLSAYMTGYKDGVIHWRDLIAAAYDAMAAAA